MRVCCSVRLPDGSTHELHPGDIIGRLRQAALHLDDVRVSEAHALISLRGDQLKLLALRGAFAVGGRPLREVVLREGIEIQLARGLHLRVEAVALPEAVLALEGEGLPAEALPSVASLVLDDPPHLVPKFVVGAAAHLWSTGASTWSARVGDGPTQQVGPGTVLEVEGRRFALTSLPLARTAGASTHMGSAIEAPLHIITFFDTAHIHREGKAVCTLAGVGARLLSELAAAGTGLHWTELARQLWPDEPERSLLRPRLDTNLLRVRRKLRNAGIRVDLVRSDGAGMIELLLHLHDRVEDRA